MRAARRIPVVLLSLIVGCGQESEESAWPEGARQAVEDRWCDGECLEVELLVLESTASLEFGLEYVFVWAHARISEWEVGRFYRSTDMPGWEKQHITDRPLYYEYFDRPPNFQDVTMILSTGSVGPDCATVFGETWLRLFGQTIASNYYLASCEN